jgi:uncharacterized GH25 family protein
MKKLVLCVVACLLMAVTASSVSAHLLWINASNYSPKAGETIYIEIGFGHTYPRDELVKEGRLEQVYALAADGRKVVLKKVFPAFYTFTPQIEGVFRIMAAFKPGFVSHTLEGRKLGNKKTLPNVVSCFAFRMRATALITCGGRNDSSVPTGHEDLSILTLKHPGDLKAGDILPLKIMFRGEPLAGAELKAACARCDLDKEHPWVQELKSDARGIVGIKVTAKGPWMFTVSHKIPYRDPDECDDYSYRTSLTIGL